MGYKLASKEDVKRISRAVRGFESTPPSHDPPFNATNSVGPSWFPANLVTDGGATGSGSSAPNYTYTIYPINRTSGTALATGVGYTYRPAANGDFAAATFGIVGKVAGNWVIYYANEGPNTFACS